MMKQILQDAMVRREFDHSYLLIKMETEQTKSYPFLMISQNTIPGLLSCKIRYEEDLPYYSYDISSKRPLIQEYQDCKLHFEEIKELFYHISAILKGSEEYLLEKEGFLLFPEYIYKDLETEEIFCLYLPYDVSDKEVEKGQYRELADFLLDKADHKDEHAVNCVYQFYKMSKEPYFSFEAFLSFLEKEELMFQVEKRRQDDKKQIAVQEVVNFENKGMDFENANVMLSEDTGNESKGTWKVWLPVIAASAMGFLLLGLYLFVPYLRYFSLYLLIPGITFILTAFLFTGKNLYHLYQSKQEPDWEATAEEITVEEYFDDILDNETVYFEDELCYQLKWKEGHFSKEFYLKEFPITVGKMKESVGLCIEDASVSRLHACFKEQGKKILLQDLDSTNGTYINGKRLAPGEAAAINRSDEIQFGKIIVNVV